MVRQSLTNGEEKSHFYILSRGRHHNHIVVMIVVRSGMSSASFAVVRKLGDSVHDQESILTTKRIANTMLTDYTIPY